jgi:hypothetical protein
MSSIKVNLQNLSPTYPQKSWVSMGLPKKLSSLLDNYNGIAKLPDGRSFPASIRGQELFVLADLKPGETVSVDCFPTGKNPTEFSFSPWVTDEIEKLIPSFSIGPADTTDVTAFSSIPVKFWDGVSPKPDAFIQFEKGNDVRWRYFFRTKIVEVPMTIEGWLDVYTNQEIVPIIVRASYGDVGNDSPLSKKLGSLSMYVGEKVVMDFAKAKGTHPIVWRNDLSKWEVELATSRVWWKARVIESFGALLAMPPYEKLGQVAMEDPQFYPKITNLKAREEAPVLGIADVWESEWLSFGKVPQPPKNSAAEITKGMQNLIRRVTTYGDEYAARDYAQPPNSGQTGEQPDFGASKCELAVTLKQPWALWDYRYSVQAWMLRPYAHKEKNGDPISVSNHPDAALYNLAVDTRFARDLLGFPNPIPYSEFWTGSDGQHRSDNLLLGMFALTRDPSIEATIHDLVRCQKMEIRPWKLFPPKGSIESPRGWGRPLISMAHLMHLGYDGVKDYLVDMIDTMYNNAALRALPNDGIHTVRTLSRWGSKYGWTDGSGKSITAWVCWEEAIAVMGLWAAFRVTGDTRARDLALEIASTIANHGFFKGKDSNWYACYAVKFNELDYGIPLPQSSYNLDPNNKEVVVYGMQRWMIPALKILLANTVTNDQTIIRAQNIVDFFGSQPADLADSGWWAV